MRSHTSSVARHVHLALAALAAAYAPAAAQAHQGDGDGGNDRDHGRDRQLPSQIDLPPGFQPEGITRGRGNTLYVASINTGGVYEADLRTGAGAILVPPVAGRAAVGIKFDARTNLLWVAGGPTGHAFAYDAATGAEVVDITLAAAGPTFINDLIITDRAIYFTESMQAVFYVLPLRHGGRPPGTPAPRAVPLTGDYQFVAGQFNANGIERTPDGDALLIVNSFVGVLYRVDARTGVAGAVDLGGGDVKNGDGLVLRDRLLYVVENFTNAIAVVKLSRDAGRGRIVDTITDPRFDIPATAVFAKGALYVTNARFTTPVTPTTPYRVVRVPIQD
jgi:sugar lactone lactonase YvrE